MSQPGLKKYRPIPWAMCGYGSLVTQDNNGGFRIYDLSSRVRFQLELLGMRIKTSTCHMLDNTHALIVTVSGKLMILDLEREHFRQAIMAPYR